MKVLNLKNVEREAFERSLNKFGLQEKGRYFQDDVFKRIFFSDNWYILPNISSKITLFRAIGFFCSQWIVTKHTARQWGSLCHTRTTAVSVVFRPRTVFMFAGVLHNSNLASIQTNLRKCLRCIFWSRGYYSQTVSCFRIGYIKHITAIKPTQMYFLEWKLLY